MSYSTRLLLGLTLLLPLIAVPASAQKSPQPSDYERFITAIDTGKIEAVQAEIDKGSDINAQYKPGTRWNNGRIPLMHAVSSNAPTPIVELLLDNGAQVDAHDRKGVTALMEAAKWGRSRVAMLLLDRGAQVSARDKKGTTPLRWAAESHLSSASIVEVLLDHGAQIQERNNTGVTTLMAAVEGWFGYSNQTAIIKLLLVRGAQVNARSIDGKTPLLIAAAHKLNFWSRTDIKPEHYSEIVKLLLEAGAEVNARDKEGNTPLAMAAQFSHTPETVRLLLDGGAEVDQRIGDGVTPLMFAVHELGFPGIVTLLIERGAEVDARSNSGSSPLHRAAQASTKSRYQAYFFFNACDTDDDRVRRGAEDLRKRSLQITQLLLDTGAQVDARDENGNTPLTVAAKGNVRPEIIQLLIEKGAEVNALNNDGSTPLIVAAQGAGTQFRDWNNHLTPFHIVELLLDKGANPLAKDASGMKAIDHARHNKALKDTPALKKLAELSGE